jgi:hypothetical protein
MMYAIYVLIGLLLGLVTKMLLTWLAVKFPLKEKPCTICNYHTKR